MKNILQAPPPKELHGRIRFCAEFVGQTGVEGKTLLDIGCGDGWFELWALERGAAGLFAMEPSDLSLGTAKANIRSASVKFLVGSALAIPLPDGAADAVVCWDVIEHVPRGTEPVMLREIRRALKPGGTAYLSTPHANWLTTLLDPAWWLLGHRHYRWERLESLATGAGFEVVEQTVRGGVSDAIYLLDLYIAKWVFRRPPFCREYFDRKTDAAYGRDGGSYTTFFKLRKPV